MLIIWSANEKAIKLITKLNRETSKGEVKWSAETPPKALTTATESEYRLNSDHDMQVALEQRQLDLKPPYKKNT